MSDAALLQLAFLGGIDLPQSAEMVLIGAVAGLMGGLLGIGGGLVMIPAMLLVLGDTLYGPDSLHIYTLASITTSFVLAVPALVQHNRQKAIVYRMLWSIIPAAIVGVVGGVYVASFFTGEMTQVLRRFFGVFLVGIATFNAWQVLKRRNGSHFGGLRCPTPRRFCLIGGVVGVPSGLIAGSLGVAGGVWSVPAQHTFMGIEIRNAIANSTAMIVVVSLFTSIAKGMAVHRMPGLQALDGWKLAVYLAPGAILGGWIGAGLTHRIPVRGLKLVVDILLAVTGLKLALS